MKKSIFKNKEDLNNNLRIKAIYKFILKKKTNKKLIETLN